MCICLSLFYNLLMVVVSVIVEFILFEISREYVRNAVDGNADFRGIYVHFVRVDYEL